MAISPLGSASVAPPEQASRTTSTVPASEDTSVVKADEVEERLSITQQREQMVKQRNLAILDANLQASLSVSDQPLSLVYQAAIDAINAELAPLMGDQAIERAQQQGLDVSPKATADRIVSLTTGLFGRFQEHRPELTESEQVERFLELISSGIDQGFTEARKILDGLGVLEGSIAENIDKTYELVLQGLERFRESFVSSEN